MLINLLVMVSFRTTNIENIDSRLRDASLFGLGVDESKILIINFSLAHFKNNWSSFNFYRNKKCSI